MTDSIYTAPGPQPLTASLQVPVAGRRYTQLGTIPASVTSINVGSCARIVFDRDCTIDDLGIGLAATYTGATTYTYRLGIYRDNGANQPGALARDAGTLTIAQNATAGVKNIALTGGNVVSVAAGESIWLVCAASHVGSVPTLLNYTGHAQPYSDYGLTTGIGNAVCFAYTTVPATALPATFTLAATQTQPIGVAVYAKVTL